MRRGGACKGPGVRWGARTRSPGRGPCRLPGQKQLRPGNHRKPCSCPRAGAAGLAGPGAEGAPGVQGIGDPPGQWRQTGSWGVLSVRRLHAAGSWLLDNSELRRHHFSNGAAGLPSCPACPASWPPHLQRAPRDSGAPFRGALVFVAPVLDSADPGFPDSEARPGAAQATGESWLQDNRPHLPCSRGRDPADSTSPTRPLGPTRAGSCRLRSSLRISPASASRQALSSNPSHHLEEAPANSTEPGWLLKGEPSTAIS